METKVRISGKMYEELKKHLYPGDGFEAVSIALCGQFNGESNELLLVHKLVHIPYDQCTVRNESLVKWSTEILHEYLTEAAINHLSIIKIHSHPNGYDDFSDTDDFSDLDLFDSIYGWTGEEHTHGSMLMLPDGRLLGRIVQPDLSFRPISRILVAGDDIVIWDNVIEKQQQDFALRTKQLLGKGTLNIMKSLTVGVVGCSGTGSPVIEQLVRLGVGSLVIVDPDVVEVKNLNRILNTTREDAERERRKVDVLTDWYKQVGLGTRITPHTANLYDSVNALNNIKLCDVVFGCVDSIDGRHLLNQLCAFYVIPYLDLGVKISADGLGGIEQIHGSVHYIKPGGSSLRSRGLYNGEELRAASLFRSNKEEYYELRANEYITNVNVESPAVISINMLVASTAINEFLARIHPFRYDPNSRYAITRLSLADGYVMHEEDGSPDTYLENYVGRGDQTPPLNMPELG